MKIDDTVIDQGIIKCSPGPQFAIGRDHKILRWNRACEHLTGRPAEVMIGTERQWEPFYEKKRPLLADLIVEHDRNGILTHYRDENIARSNIIPHAWEASGFFSNVGGKARYLHFIAAPIFEFDGTIIGAVQTFLDITRLKHFETALMQSLEGYRILAENVPDGVALMQKGKFVLVNEAFAKIFGFKDRKELIGGDTGINIREDERERFRDTISAIEKGESDLKVLRWPCITKDGREIWAEGHPNRVRWEGYPAVLTTVIDITENRSQVKALEAEAKRLKRENIQLKSSIKDRYRLSDIVGASSSMNKVYKLILQAASSDAGVIVYGESGTGKELVAKAIHEMSERRNGTFVPVNCGAIPEQLLESEFFGHRKGAFTGAYRNKEGFLDLADKGTLFLDEVGELSQAIQVKFLRAIEGSGYTAVGGTETKKSDFRVVAATNRNLNEHMKRGLMRSDFFYRIHVIPIDIPPLRCRREDIPFLIDHFLRQQEQGKMLSDIPGRVLEAFYNYDWPGNVRELQNALHRYLTVGKVDFIRNISNGISMQALEDSGDPLSVEKGPDLRDAIESLEKMMIKEALANTNWNRSRAAAILGIPRKTLFRKMKKFGVVSPEIETN